MGWTPVTLGSRAAAILSALLREPGAAVSKDALMDAVWPNTTVEANNLTVQITALRRVLGEGGSGESLIQTVAGRGYRFVGVIGEPDRSPSPFLPSQAEADPPPPSRGKRLPARWLWAGGCSAAALVLLLLLAIIWPGLGSGPARAPPRMSLAVMPFENLGGNPDDDYLARGLTDDLIAQMSMILQGFVIGADAARPPAVRYQLRGSVRKLGTMLRVNAQLASTETNTALWADRFDVSIADLGHGQEQAVDRIAYAVMEQEIATEDQRSRRERPNDPDALDLVLRAIALEKLAPSEQRLAQEHELYERAWHLDPSLEAVRIGLTASLLDDEDANPHGRKAVLERTRKLLVDIGVNQPASWRAMLTKLYWLSWQYDRCPETIELAQRVIATYPKMLQAYRWFGDCLTRVGRADEALPVLQHAVEVGADDRRQSHNERNLQYALLLLGRYDESIAWGTRALAANPDDMGWERARITFRLAAAEALSGRIDDARRDVAKALKLRSLATVRQFGAGQDASPAYAAQVARLLDGLRFAGLRDHAVEDTDFGTPSDAQLHQRWDSPTPLSAPGATTIGTDALVALLATQKPIVIDTLVFSGGRSIPGAVGLRFVGEGGNLTDAAQDHLRAKMQELKHSDLHAPVVAVGWNTESFDGRNLALRLSALGYTNVFWYRGGREAWEVRQLPETELAASDW